MKRSTFSVAFYCRKSRMDKKGLSPIELSLSINSDRVFISLARKMRYDEFERMMRSRRANDLQMFLNDYRKRIDDAVAFLTERKKPIMADSIKEILMNGYTSDMYSIERLFKEYYDRNKDDYSLIMIRKWKLTYSQLSEFFGSDKDISEIDDVMIEDFQKWLERRYKDSTTKNYCTRVKQLFRYAFQKGYIKRNPTESFKLKTSDILVEYLTEDEVAKIATKTFSNERLEKVRRLALFMCFSGLSYVDLKYVDINDCIEVDNGCLMYCNSRQKTQIGFTTIILPMGVEILKEFGGTLKNAIPSNQKINSYLKEIGDVTGITKNLHCHLFRKTYATFLINRNVSISVISKALGHSNTITTQKIYAHLQAEQIANEITSKCALTHQVK